ncbi:ABC transporter ATP-binding protein [bacterium]|nr:ABC transporter ATP-binding protein [bacterium]
MNNNILQVKDLHKTYNSGADDELKVLQGIDLEIKSNETIGIVGVSGSGKSTLLHILASLDHPTSGNVMYKGIDLYGYKDKELSNIRNREFGFVFQFHYLLKELTAFENVLLPSMIGGSEDRERVKYLLDEVGMLPRKDHYPNELSGGELQRIAIARALVNSPTILFADEPTGELDNENGEKIFSLMVDIVDKFGATLVLVTHNSGFASRTEKKYALNFGKLEQI